MTCVWSSSAFGGSAPLPLHFGKSSAVLEKVQEQGGIWYTFPMNDMSQKVAVLQQKLLELQDYL